MVRRLKDNFDRGIEKIKWFSSLLSERLRIEYVVIKLLFQSDRLEKKRDELLKKIGQRVLEMKEHIDKQILRDRIIAESLSEIEKIKNDIDITKKKASEISSSL
jgi:seryl-tRNA synthetase